MGTKFFLRLCHNEWILETQLGNLFLLFYSFTFYWFQVYETPALQEPENLEKAVCRYETNWLPLLAEYGSKNNWNLSPPLDVAWVWHCHMMAPKFYISDCQRITGKCLFKTSWAQTNMIWGEPWAKLRKKYFELSQQRRKLIPEKQSINKSLINPLVSVWCFFGKVNVKQGVPLFWRCTPPFYHIWSTIRICQKQN